MKRIQFYVDDILYEKILEYSRENDRPMGNLALHALRQYMRRYPLKSEDKVLGIKSV